MRYGAVGTFLRRDAAEKGEVAAARLRGAAMQATREAVVDGGREVCVRHRAALGVRDRNQRHVVEAQIEREQIGQVLAAVQRGDSAACDRPEQREMELIDMEMQDVEVVGALADAIEHQHVIGDRIADAGVEPECLGHAGHEIGRRDRIAAREQRHVMAEANQFLGQVGDDPLGAAVKSWGDAFHQGRNLRDFQFCPFQKAHRSGTTHVVMAKANSEGRLCYFDAEGTARTCNVAHWHKAGRRDLNPRPPVPQTGALTGLRHAPTGTARTIGMRLSQRNLRHGGRSGAARTPHSAAPAPRCHVPISIWRPQLRKSF